VSFFCRNTFFGGSNLLIFKYLQGNPGMRVDSPDNAQLMWAGKGVVRCLER